MRLIISSQKFVIWKGNYGLWAFKTTCHKTTTLAKAMKVNLKAQSDTGWITLYGIMKRALLRIMCLLKATGPPPFLYRYFKMQEHPTANDESINKQGF